MNETITITKEISNEVETMVLLGSQFQELKRKHPRCLDILKKQFGLSDYDNSNIVDDIENVKLKLYAEILSSNTVKAKKLEADVVKAIASKKK